MALPGGSVVAEVPEDPVQPGGVDLVIINEEKDEKASEALLVE